MRVELEISDETLTNLVREELVSGYRAMRGMHRERSQGDSIPYRYLDLDQDLEELSRMAEAYRLVLGDFVIPGEPLGIEDD